MTRRIRLVLTLTFLLAGCGVPAEREPRAITPDANPTAAASGPGASAPEVTSSTGSGMVLEVLYFVRDGRLVAVRRPVERLPPPETHFEHLLVGPSEAEHNEGLSSALTGLGMTAHLRIEALTAVVDLGVQPDNAGRSDEVLAYGQLVCTLTARPDVDTVSFRHEDKPVDVPRGDASLGRQPLTAADYESLVAPE